MLTKRKINGVLIEFRLNSDGSLLPLSQNGLGDKIERIAKPIARVIDKIARAKIAGCGGCKKMKERLNAGMILGEALKLRIQGK